MKIAIVYTSTTPQMISIIEDELRSSIKDNLRSSAENEELQILMYTDPTIIKEAVANSKITEAIAKRLIKMYMDASIAGAKIIYNICSSVGDIADEAKSLFKKMGVDIIRIDEEMVISAIKSGKRIGVIATLKTTLEPTKNLIKRCSKEMGMDIEIIDALAEGAFGKTQAELEEILINKALSISDKIDVIVLAQASMSLCEEKIANATKKIVVSSPKFGAKAVSKAILQLKNGGVINE